MVRDRLEIMADKARLEKIASARKKVRYWLGIQRFRFKNLFNVEVYVESKFNWNVDDMFSQLKKFQEKKGPSTPPKLPTKPAAVETSQTKAKNDFVSLFSNDKICL